MGGRFWEAMATEESIAWGVCLHRTASDQGHILVLHVACHVLAHRGLARKLLAAKGARVHARCVVDDAVLGEAASLNEPLAADIALVQALACVDTLVLREIAEVCKGLVTDLALVRAKKIVSPLVLVEA